MILNFKLDLYIDNVKKSQTAKYLGQMSFNFEIRANKDTLTADRLLCLDH